MTLRIIGSDHTFDPVVVEPPPPPGAEGAEPGPPPPLPPPAAPPPGPGRLCDEFLERRHKPPPRGPGPGSGSAGSASKMDLCADYANEANESISDAIAANVDVEDFLARAMHELGLVPADLGPEPHGLDFAELVPPGLVAEGSNVH